MSEPARSTDMVSDELMACPFERGTCNRECLEIVVETDSSKRPGVFHGYVKCCDCGACGPEAWADEDSIRSLAVFDWNDRARISRAPIEAVAWQRRFRETGNDGEWLGWELIGKRLFDEHQADPHPSREVRALYAHPLPQGEAEPAAAGISGERLDIEVRIGAAVRHANRTIKPATDQPIASCCESAATTIVLDALEANGYSITRPLWEAGDTDEPVERLWRDLLEKDDRTSPVEYPDMALITFDEFRAAQATAVRAFTNGVLHGDNEHREWLLAAAEACIAGQPMPPPNGKGRAEAAEASLAAAETQMRAMRELLTEARNEIADYADTASEFTLIVRIDAALAPVTTPPAAETGGSK